MSNIDTITPISVVEIDGVEVPLVGTEKPKDMLQERVDLVGCKNLFREYSGETMIDISRLDTSQVTDMSFAFYGCTYLRQLDLSTFNTENVTTMSDMFNNCQYLTNLKISSFNTSNVTTLRNMFKQCSNITSLNLSSFDTSQVKSLYYTFASCTKLKTITGVLNLINCTDFSNSFNSCSVLENVTLKNIKKSINTYSSKLSNNTLINTIKELWDYSSGTTTYKLTIGTTNIAKLTDVYVKLVTPTAEQIEADPNIIYKKPCVVCESTDEGAILITEYATSKMWSIA